MAQWVNVGIRNKNDKSDFPTKTAARRAIPANVEFYVTDAFGPNADKVLTPDELDISVMYSVVGPNPYTSRKWYGTAQKTCDGRILLK